MKAAVILFGPWGLDGLGRAVALARAVHGAAFGGGQVERVVLGLPEGSFDETAMLERLRAGHAAAEGLVLRPFMARTYPTADVLLTRRPLPEAYARVPEVLVADDGGYCFRDCDAGLVLLPTGMTAPLLLEIPHAAWLPDLSMRRVAARQPHEAGQALNLFLSLRAARVVVAEDAGQAAAATGYAGVPQARVMTLGNEAPLGTVLERLL